MEGNFEVTYRGQTVGTVEVKQEGLYCRLSCRCRMSDRAVHRLYASGERIGVLIPDRGDLVLETRAVAKRLKPGCNFTLDQNTNTFIPIRPGEAFPHLDKLRSGRLGFREGIPGLII